MTVEQAKHLAGGISPTSLAIVGSVVVTLGVIAIGVSGPNLELALLSALTFVIGVACLWRPGEPPSLLFIFVIQWLQASTAIFQATLDGKPINDFYENAGAVSDATILTLLALIALAAGLRLGVGGARPAALQQAINTAATRPMRDWFMLYVAAWIGGAIATWGIPYASGLQQLLNSANVLRWAFFFMLAYVHFSRQQKTGLWFPAAFLFELASSLGGYFSDFKSVFVFTFLALVMAGIRLSATRVLLGLLVAVAAFGIGLVWTAVKPEYRQFASGGQTAQIVTVDYGARVMKLAELVSELDGSKIDRATDDLLSRIGYVEYFGSTISYVPSVVPHEGGAILWDAFTRPFMPRILFPDKPIIDDSERTRYYTGRNVAGAEEGTSISLGWPAEMYIDFGKWGMMAAALAIGLFYGLLQRFLTRWTWSQGLLGYAMASAILVSASMLESSMTKVAGGVIASLLVALLIIRLVIPSCCPWVAGPQWRR